MANMRLTPFVLAFSSTLACVPSIIESADDSTGTGDSHSDASPNAVDLGAAGEFVLLAKSGISMASASTVTGDVGLSPAGATFITGFSLLVNETGHFASSPQVDGHVYCADYASPTPAELSAAVQDMQLAFEDVGERTADTTDLGAGDIGGLTLAPGVYAWGTEVSIPTSVTLEGSATDVWIFRIAEDLVIGSDARIVLAGGAVANNVVWQVGGAVDIGEMASCAGIILAKTSATLRSGASLDGRLLAQTAIDLHGSAVTEPAD